MLQLAPIFNWTHHCIFSLMFMHRALAAVPPVRLAKQFGFLFFDIFSTQSFTYYIFEMAFYNLSPSLTGSVATTSRPRLHDHVLATVPSPPRSVAYSFPVPFFFEIFSTQIFTHSILIN
ncbi:hypothetical protein B0H17DRAFT_1195067 [Mycena rosella]|uniref:Secreted protein n=1 Tax=Mycena rosella TaxID=1033263 RepID=A0AAD7DXX6_MYCRO|nr:hypothetical protein B0H17DRAFT_1195067 [Mycena rosella]